MPAPQNQKNDLVAKSLHFLKYRPRSREEIRKYLASKTNNSKIIHQVIKYLDELKLINDQEFAQWFVRGRLKQSKGPRLISKELTYKFGVNPELVKQTLSTIDNKQLLTSAQTALNKKLRQLSKYPPFEAKQRVYRYLYQRGFTSNTITAAIDESNLGE
ncbi:regulatory protein RecX [Pseudomonadota bacterium]